MVEKCEQGRDRRDHLEPSLACDDVLVRELRMPVDAAQEVLLEHPDSRPTRVVAWLSERCVAKDVIVEAPIDGQRVLLRVHLPVVLPEVDVVARVGAGVQAQRQAQPVRQTRGEDGWLRPPVGDASVVAKVAAVLIRPPALTSTAEVITGTQCRQQQ